MSNCVNFSAGGGVPIGTIISFMGLTPPADYLACDGSTKNITDYPQLADFFEAQFGSKNYFGGDGVTTFAVPDLQGEFLRGTGTNSHAGQGSGANVGVHQDGTKHVDVLTDNDKIYLRRTTSTDVVVNGDYYDGSTTWVGYKDSFTGTFSSATDGMFTSRPTNTSVLYCIKAIAYTD